MKRLFFFVLTLMTTLSATSQNCAGVLLKKDKQQRTETYSGIASSNEFYSLIVSRKHSYGNSNVPVAYNLFLNVSSKVLFPDSVLQTTGVLEFIFADETSIAFDKVLPSNNPLGYCCAIGFSLDLSEEQFVQITTKSITQIIAFGKVKALFSGKKEKRLKDILGCLLNKK